MIREHQPITLTFTRRVAFERAAAALPPDVFTRPIHLTPTVVTVNVPAGSTVREVTDRAMTLFMVASTRYHGISVESGRPRLTRMRALIRFMLEEIRAIAHSG